MQILDEIHNGGDANVDPNIAQQYLDHIQVSVQDSKFMHWFTHTSVLAQL